MNLVVVLEYRFMKTPDGRVWTPTTFAYNFWQRYLEVFDSVRVVARVQDELTVPDGCQRADGVKVTFAPVPYYVGPWQFALRGLKVRRTLQEAVTPDDAVILRVPSTLANLMVPVLRKRHQPFGLEVLGNPWEVFSHGAVKYSWPVRMLARWWFTKALRKQCREAHVVAYVTQFALQRCYPPSKNYHFFNYSDIELNNHAFPSTVPRFFTHYSSIELTHSSFEKVENKNVWRKENFLLITVGSLDQLYKGVDVLIDAISLCTKDGLDIYLVIVGDGKYRSYLEARCRKRRIEDRVCFLGQLQAGEPLQAQLDQADLFVLASRTEGLPRAMLEAMARKLPCIGTTVGGIPELLQPEDMVPPNNPDALAAKIIEVLGNPKRMEQMSLRNVQKAQEYREEVLRERRRSFYENVRKITIEWQKRIWV